ncbi:hypothetical protein, partial [Streptomyces atacamensis]|uniref:hypothetical protein n=1 Tax=Streptomyces atacamensis TaxID=531966 RepID=UPI00399C8D52
RATAAVVVGELGRRPQIPASSSPRPCTMTGAPGVDPRAVFWPAAATPTDACRQEGDREQETLSELGFCVEK